MYHKITGKILYFCVFYILASSLKCIYMFFINNYNINRVIIGCFYADEIIISILVILFIKKYVKIVQHID